MPDEIKRLHYYDQQFLREPDFTDEQKYHMDMRRRHNGFAHGWGIVDGLRLVKKDDQTVTLQPGTALDADGREIILVQGQDIAIPGGASNAGRTYYVTIRYKLPEDLTDPPPPQDMITPADRTRVTERPEIPAPSLTLPADPSRTLVVGAVLLNAAGNIASVDEASRSYIPRGVGGNFGVGTISPAAKLQVSGGAIMPATGNTSSAGIQFPPDPGGGAGDRAYIRYFVESGETTKLLIGCENDADDRISFYQFGGERLTIYNGSVGIGTTSPAAKLQVSGGAIMPAIGNTSTAGIQFPPDPGGGAGDRAYIRYFVESGETTKLLIGCENDADDRISFYQFGGERLTIYNGNVGIGTLSPGAPLEVVGNISLKSPDTNIYSLQLSRKDENNRTHKWALWHMNNAYRKNALEIWEYKTDSNGVDCGGNTADGAMCNPRLVILEGGNVGIGTTNPQATLDVNGTLEVAQEINCARWKITHVLTQAAGPLTGNGLAGAFTSAGGTLVVFASGSGYSNAGGKQIGMQVNVDNMMMGSAKVYTNEPSSHKSFVATSIIITSVGAGNHTVKIYNLNLDTFTDQNDFFDVTVLELPFR